MSFKRILDGFGWFTGLSAVIASIAKEYYGYNWIYTFTISLFITWIFHTEVRIRDLQNRRKK